MSSKLIHKLATATAIALMAVLGVLAPGAGATSPLMIEDFDGEIVNKLPDGTPIPATQAGSHPVEAWTEFGFETEIRPAEPGVDYPTASVKDVEVRLPPGLIGNPTAVPTCTEQQLSAGAGFATDVAPQGCPLSSQVGFVRIETALSTGPRWVGIFNLEPTRPDVAAQFGFNVLFTGPVHLEPELRSDGDYGLNVVAKNSSQGAGVLGLRAVLFGVPGDAVNDTMRGQCIQINAGEFGFIPDPFFECPTDMTPDDVKPFITLPTSCSGPQSTTLSVNSWQFPDHFDAFTFLSHEPGDRDAHIGADGCENVPFDPTFEVTPHNTQAGAPSGYTVDLRIPDEAYDDPESIVQSHLRRAVVRMPEGVTMNPSAADGLQGCSDAQVGLDSRADAQCPDGSKIAEVTVQTPVLEDPLEGSVFLGTQLPDDRYRMFIVVNGPGMIVKLQGSVTPHPETGQLTATFNSNPQLPFSHMQLRFKGGPRAPLSNPRDCGTYTMTSELTPWSGNAPATPSDSFAIACPGHAGEFQPDFVAGAISPVAGAFSPFVARFTRDRGKDIDRIVTHMPVGQLANLRDVEVCGEPQLAAAASRSGTETRSASACPAGSQVGAVTVGAGAGPNPYYPMLPGSSASGRVFLTGPYDGGHTVPNSRPVAYGLAIEVPAVAGPFDLGTVLVRAAVFADTSNAKLTVLSDRIPRILEGVPLNTRDIRVNIDRPGFTLNPSSCARKEVATDILAADGGSVRRSARFQVGECSDLKFNPRIGMRLTGRRQTTTGKHPGVRAVVRQTGVGEAGIRRAEVRLPKTLALDPDNAQALCEYEDGIKPDLENHCPQGSIIGRARAKSPLLKRDLVGNVYFVKNVRTDPNTGNVIRTLPMLIVGLRGEVAINLRGVSSTTKSNQLVNTFAGVPDAPITRFNLNIKGGSNGILAVTGSRQGNLDVCRGQQTSRAFTRGQNGDRSMFKIRMLRPCGKGGQAIR